MEDCAKAIRLAVERYENDTPVNIGTGQKTSIKDLLSIFYETAGFKGRIVWDTRKPNGQPRRFPDVSKAEEEFGFRAKLGFE